MIQFPARGGSRKVEATAGLITVHTLSYQGTLARGARSSAPKYQAARTGLPSSSTVADRRRLHDRLLRAGVPAHRPPMTRPSVSGHVLLMSIRQLSSMNGVGRVSGSCRCRGGLPAAGIDGYERVFNRARMEQAYRSSRPVRPGLAIAASVLE